MRISASRAGTLSMIIAAAAAAPASGQTIPQDMRNALNRKYDIQQQQADTERMRAESERLRTEAEINRSQGQNYSSPRDFSGSSAGVVVPKDRDSLGGVNAAAYKLGNGVVLQFSGDFRPDPPTVCIANCP